MSTQYMKARSIGNSQTTAGNDPPVELEDDESTDSPREWHERAVSQIKLTDPSLLRGVIISKVLRHLGEVLSRKPARRDYYAWSMEVKRISIFISHSWATPRWSKLLVLLLHFNLWPAMAISSLVSLICCWLVVRGTIPHVVGETLRSEGQLPQSVACTPIGVVTFWVSLFALHELDRFCGPCMQRTARTAFLDKICIHQTDLERKKQAVQSLAAFLANSDHMLVCYSDLYLRRLWTIYEVATWLIVQPGKTILVRPCSGPQMLLFAQLMMCIYVGAVFTMTETSLVASVPSSWFVAATFLCGIGPFAALLWYEARWADDECKLKDVVENFSLASAQCAVEEDRPVIEANIVAFMKYARLSAADGEDGEVVKAFEDLVHRKVPELLTASFGRAGLPYAWALVPVLPVFFYLTDQIADFIMRDVPLSLFCFYVISFAVGIFAWGPLCMGAIMKIMRRSPCMRSLRGCVSVGTVVSLLTAVEIALTRLLPEYAMESDLGLAALLGMWVATTAAVVAVYRF